MKTMTLLTIGAAPLATGHIAPMVAGLIGLVIIFVMLGSIGLHEAWQKKRTALGWIVSYLIAFGGGVSVFLLDIALQMQMDKILKQDGPPSDGRIFVTFIAAAVGSWFAVRVASRFR